MTVEEFVNSAGFKRMRDIEQLRELHNKKAHKNVLSKTAPPLAQATAPQVKSSESGTAENARERLAAMLPPLTDDQKLQALAEKAPEDRITSPVYEKNFFNIMQGKTRTGASFKALSPGGDGAFYMPVTFENAVTQALEEENVLRKLARVVQINEEHRVPITLQSGVAAWVEEYYPMPEIEPVIGVLSLTAKRIGVSLKVSEDLFADAAFDLQDYITRELARCIARCEEDAFINGDGDKKPVGLLTDAEIGVTAGQADAITFDELIRLYYALPVSYRRNATFLLNDATAQALRGIKDSTGQCLWQYSQTGEPDRLLGRPVVTSQFMPVIAPGAKVIAFGDFSNYWIGDRRRKTFNVLHQAYALNGLIGFTAGHWTDGKLAFTDAVKVLQMSAGE